MLASDSPVSEVMVKFPSLHWNKEKRLIKLNIFSLYLKTRIVWTHYWFGVLQGFVSSSLAAVFKESEDLCFTPMNKYFI